MASFKTSNTPYPETMRTQLWPLCCGASIISGFKNVGTMDHDELVKTITDTCSAVPDHQVYQNEKIIPKMTYLTLNEQQTQSVKIMSAVLDAGFVKFATAKPRGSLQSFFVRDISNTFKLEQDTKVAA